MAEVVSAKPVSFRFNACEPYLPKSKSLNMEAPTILWLASALLLIAGFAGLVCAAWAEGFAYVGWGTIAILAALTAAAYLIDFLAGLFGAGKYGVMGAAIGTVIGLLVGLPGIIIGPFIGAVLGELYAHKNLQSASTAGLGVWIGMAIGIAARIAVAFINGRGVSAGEVCVRRWNRSERT